MGKVLKGVTNYATGFAKSALNPFDIKSLAQYATNTDPGDIVRNTAGDGVANTLHGVVDSVAPAIVSAFLSPAAGAALTSAINYGNGGSLGSSLGKGALSLGGSFAGNAIGGLAAGGGSSSFSPSSLFGSGSSGTFGGGGKDFANLFKTNPNIASGLSSAATNLTPTDVSSIADPAITDNVGTFGSNTPAALNNLSTGAGKVASNTNLVGNIGLGRALAGAVGGVGQGLVQNQATADQLKAIKGQQQNLNTFDPSGITSDPGYQFQYDQGLQGLQRQLAAAGGTQSGAALKAAQEYGQGYANNAFNDYYNRWAAKTGAQNQLLANKGNVQAGGLLGQGQNFSTTLNNIFNPNQGFSLGDILKQRLIG